MTDEFVNNDFGTQPVDPTAGHKRGGHALCAVDHEGDLIRAMRRLIDLLRQLAESAEVPGETRRLLVQVARTIDRGIVLESALI